MSVKKEKRKRKHSETEVITNDENDSSEQVSEIVETTTPKKMKNDELMQQNGETKRINFLPKQFRKSLKSTDAIEHVKNFVSLSNEPESDGYDYALEYLRTGGSIKEILQILETDKKNMSIATPVFEATQILLLKIQKSVPDHLCSAEESCRYMLSSFLPTIHGMLHLNATPKQKRVVLKLLTVVTTLSSQLAKDILVQVDFNDSMLETLTKQTDGVAENSVRTAFIHFLMSFIIEGNSSIIRAFLEKKKLLPSIFAELIYDDSDLVQLVLSAVRVNIVENPTVSKTIKLHNFNSAVMRHLVNLYNWKGRKFWKLKIRKKLTTLPENTVDPDDKDNVSQIVHQLLLVLLTSKKFGLVFHDKTLGLSGKYANKLVFTVLEVLDRPWEHKYASQLVTKIAFACPDLYNYILTSVESYLEPRSSAKWLNVIVFVKNIIKSISFEHFLADFKELNMKQILTVVQNFCTPNAILKFFTHSKCIAHGDPFIREVSIDLLLTILLHLDEVVSYLEKQNINDFTILKKSLYDGVFKILPPSKMLMKTWSMIDNKSIYTESKQIFESYLIEFNIKLAIIELLKFYVRNSSTTDIDIESLTPKDVLLEGDRDKRLLIKASELFLMINSDVFSPDQEYFVEYMSEILTAPDDLFVLQRILKGLEIFVNAHDEISIWLEGATILNDTNFPLIFSKILNSVHTNLNDYQTKVNTIQKKHNDIIDVGSVDIFEILEYSNFKGYSTRQIVPSPVILGFFESLENRIVRLTENDRKIFSYILINLLHAQTTPAILIELITPYSKIIKKYLPTIFEYLFEWQNGNVYLELSNDITKGHVLNTFSRALLEKKVIDFQIDTNFRNVVEMIVFYLNRELNTDLEQLTTPYDKFLITIFTHDSSLMQIYFNHPVMQKFYVPLSRKSNNEKIATDLTLKLMQNTTINNNLLEPYREKFIIRLLIAIKKYKKYLNCSSTAIDDSLTILKLTPDDNWNILTNILELPCEAFLTKGCNEISIFLKLFCHTLNQIKKFLNEQQFGQILTILKFLYTSGVSLDFLWETFMQFLIKYPHYLKFCSTEFYKHFILKNEFTRTETKFIVFLVTRKPNLMNVITEHFHHVMKIKELIIPLIECENIPIDQLSLVYTEFEPLVMKTIEKPHKTSALIRNHPKAIVNLIVNSMPSDKCEKIAQKTHKFEVVEKFHLEILESVYTKGKNSVNYLQTILNLLNVSLKRGDVEKIDILTAMIEKHAPLIDDWEKLSAHSIWENYVKVSLKHGMAKPDNFLLLRALRILCLKIYDNEKSVEDINAMIQSHSEFLNILLSSNDTQMEQKLEILKLLLIFARHNPTVLTERLVPILLGAYTATQHLKDRLILALLYLYEANNVNLDTYKPFLWGEYAINYYSVRHSVETALWRQPRMTQVLDLLRQEVVLNTINNFDWLQTFSTISDANTLLEAGNTVGDERYDLNFLLPLFSFLLSSDSIVKCYKFTQSGGLALTLLALASNCNVTRQAAYTVLGRFYFHLEANFSNKESKLWLELVNHIRNGLQNLITSETGEATETNIRISCISAVFLARASLIMTQPLNPLYVPINNFIFVKESVNLTPVPELLQLFHSSEIDYKIHRQWILTVIRDGFKNALDFTAMMKCLAFKMITDFYSSYLCDLDTRLIVLEIIERALLVPKAAKFLLFEFSVISWVDGICHKLSKHEYRLIEQIVKVVKNVCHAIGKLKTEPKYIQDQVVILLKRLLSVLSIRISPDCFLKYLQIINDKCNLQRLSKENVLRIIHLGEVIFGGEHCCEYILQFGYEFDNVNTLICGAQLTNTNLGKSYLKQFVIKWIKNNNC